MHVTASGREVLNLSLACVVGGFSLRQGGPGGQGSGMFGTLPMVTAFLTLVSTVPLLV